MQDVLPSANCGGCGFPGCRNFAEALVEADSFDGLYCPVGGMETMTKAANILGKVLFFQLPMLLDLVLHYLFFQVLGNNLIWLKCLKL